MDLTRFIDDVPNFPKPGILFRDITPLLADARAFAHAVDAMAAAIAPSGVDLVAGIEARGFIFGAALAARIGRGFVPLRKPGKLPGLTVGVDYALEYGNDRLEARDGSMWHGARVLVVDDVLATGGTMAAAIELVQRAGATPVAATVLIELPGLNGRFRLPPGFPLARVLSFR
ncbi:MAG TPA: adenine phosphoribosyltransferase [Candidatus Saccharimonadia bacterium]|nr:adenine phosphoribosyltransferase [Candidatus Saccharimonadia bacterium]